MKIESIYRDKDLISQVVSLGTKNSKTLGHFPEGAYVEHAHRGFLICAHEKQKLFGYLLYSITQSKSCIRIIQLCVADNARNKGVALALLDSLKEKYRDSFKGMTLNCRADYIAASALWEKYGFKAMNKVRSRSKKENYLYKWWYDFGNHDLFSLSHLDSSKPKAVLDASIIIKLRSKTDQDSTGSHYLLDDWLVDYIDYFYAPEIFNEIKRDKDDIRAGETRSFITNFYEVKFNPDKRDQVFREVDKLIPGNSKNDISDKKQLSECIAGDIGYFITTDKKILNAEIDLKATFGVTILRPIDLILMIDENTNKSNYLSTRLSGVNIDQARLRSKEVDDLVNLFLAKNNQEKKHELREVLIGTVSDIKNSQTRVIRDRNKQILAICVFQLTDDQVKTPIIRTTKSKISETLFKQLLTEAVAVALSHEKELIKITDRTIEPKDQETLESMGFVHHDDFWLKYTSNLLISTKELFEIQTLNSLLDKSSIEKKLLKANSQEFKLSLERKLFPLKFTDIDISTYIIPIKPYWASQLFDYRAAESTIFGARASLVWSRENIYYRNVRPVSEITPARILWYSSTSNDRNSIRTNSIVGCSYLDEVHLGTAKELFRRFQHYGVYEWKNILALSKGNPNHTIKALKFSDTETFPQTITYDEITGILQANGRKKNSFVSPVKVTNEIFLEIYKLGTNT